MSNNKVKSIGYNSFGQLGYGDTIQRGNGPNSMGDYLDFVNIDQDIISIMSGGYGACIQTVSFQIKCWGDNLYGTLGTGNNVSLGDDPNEMGSYLPSVNIGSNLFVTRYNLGFFHVMTLSDSGQLKAWGHNLGGQL